MDTLVICASPFWNESVSWNTPNPYFSECFKHLILVIASCAVLWVIAPLEFIKICRYQGTPSPWTTLSISKISLKAILLLICLIELIKEAYAYATGVKTGLDGLIAAIAYLITIILTVVITMMCKKRGLRSSFALPSFWMISTIATLISIYDDIHAVEINEWVSVASLVDDGLTFFISLVQLVLSCIADKEMTEAGRQFTKYCPLEGSGFPSKLTFSWLLKIIAKSADNSLHQDYLIPQCYELKSSTVTRNFNDIWKNIRETTEQPSATGETTRLLSNDTIQSPETASMPSTTYRRKPSLLSALMKTSRKYLLISSALEILFTALYFLPSYLLSLILSSGKEPDWHKYLFATTLFIVLLLSSFADSQRKYFGLVAALRIKTAVMNAVFEKALVSQDTQDVKDHLHEDSENIFQMVCLATEVWGAPMRLIIGFYLLYLFLGPACFAGFATAALLIPLNVMISTTASNFQNKSTEVKKDRLNGLSEIFRGIKLLKIYAWEEVFMNKQFSLRKSELKSLRTAMFLKMAFKFLILSSTSLVAVTTFLVYVLMDDSIDGRVIFVCFSLICLLKTPFTSLLRLFAYFVQGLASVSRIQTFLETNEIAPFSSADDSEVGLLLEHASFTWAENETPYLKNLNLNARANSVIAVVGDSQSGKSSFLRALLGQMQNVNGKAEIKGEIAFVGDSAWIQNTTLERNILFVKPKEVRFYRRALEVCELLADIIELLPEGEETEIGEKGYQLNEDQKLKVDLARAVYQDADIYLLDDPFRCADAETAKQLYFRVIGHSGILHRKIRIFTTTETEFVPLVDQILFLQDGRIVERGKYSELIEKDGFFARYEQMKSDPLVSEKKSHKLSKSNFRFTNNIKDHCDPWYSATGVFFKPEVENLMHGETSDDPKGFFRKLLGFIKMNGYILTISSVLLAIAAGCSEAAGWMWWTQWTEEHTNSHKVYKKLYIYASFVLTEVVCTALCGVLMYASATFAVKRLFCWSLNRIMRATQSTFVTTFIERVCHSFDKDLQCAEEQIPLVIYIWLIAVMKASVLLIVMFIKSPLLCVFSVPLILAFCVVLKLYVNAWQQLHRLTAATRCPLSNLLKEVLQGMPNIRAYKANAHFITRFKLKLDTYNNCYFLFLLVSRWLSSSIEIIGSFLVLLAASAALADDSSENYFVGMFIVFAMEISENLTAVSYMSSLLDVDLSSIEKFQSFEQIKQEAEWENPASDLPHSWPSQGSVYIWNLSTASYGEELYPMISNIDLSVTHPQKVAIIGKEESGIYTILDSLFRIREISEGRICVGNRDISNIGLHDLRSRLAFIPRDHFVFSGTVRENLDPKQDYLDEHLLSVVRTVHLNNNFTDLSEVIGDDISHEDKLKFSVARCILKNSKLVIIDNPGKTCYREIFKDSTVLAFGEIEALEGFDRIIHISCGEIKTDLPSSATFRC